MFISEYLVRPLRKEWQREKPASIRGSSNLQWLVILLPAIQSQLAVDTSGHIIGLETWCVFPAGVNKLFGVSSQNSGVCVGRTCLLGLAFPSSLSLVRPLSSECRLPRLYHSRRAGILICVAFKLGLDGCKQGPSAVSRMSNVFEHRVVAGLPSVKALLAQKTHHIIRVFCMRAIDEPRFGQLPYVSKSCFLAPRRLLLRTSAGAMVLCGQFRAFPPRPAAVEPLFLFFWKDAKRPS